jgi:acetoacetyl-CoA synthetase
MAVSQDWDNDTRVVLFIVVKEGQNFDEEVAKEIKKALRDQASPRHVPDKIVVAPELPRTKSNKLVELAVTDVINGREVRNRDALANPNSLDWFKDLPELLK